ncbi:sigma-54 interaction domain-containing protein [Paraburkholderia bannensis]|uniref:sigma-54 interaction domain-containing protein n=1 Tax=Paraburkholderia bannensis TaxID=765414 RepID=UPI002AC34C51|nr:sigma 54-interacting transcriptional regulator [Paraburkholderia bannensis]
MRFAQTPLDARRPFNAADIPSFLGDPRWEAICDLIPEGVTVVDAGGVVTYMNTSAESLNELRKTEWIGRTFEDFIEESCLRCEALRNAWRGAQRLPDTAVRAGERMVSISARPLRDSQGLPCGYLFFQRKLSSPSAAPSAPVRDAGERPLFAASALWDEAYRIGLRAIDMNSRVLLLGESGVGKTELARQLHTNSTRRHGHFIHVSCAGIPESLFESEMFGYDRGSFTGALSKGKAGLIEAADGGTLFLDEIGEMPLALQAKLLVVLESGRVHRLGSTQPKTVDIRVIAATNRDLEQLVAEGKFRSDLYYRLSVITLSLPPLREQKMLIGPLLDYFVALAGERRGKPFALAAECRPLLEAHGFPGNVRELQNLVEYLAVVCDEVAQIKHLPRQVGLTRAPLNDAATLANASPGAQSATPAHPASLEGASLKSLVREFENGLIADAITRYGSKRKAAEMLQTDIATIVRKSKLANAA